MPVTCIMILRNLMDDVYEKYKKNEFLWTLDILYIIDMIIYRYGRSYIYYRALYIIEILTNIFVKCKNLFLLFIVHFLYSVFFTFFNLFLSKQCILPVNIQCLKVDHNHVKEIKIDWYSL